MRDAQEKSNVRSNPKTQVRCLNLGLEVDVSFRGIRHAGGTAALLRQRLLAFYYVQLQSTAAVVEDGAIVGTACSMRGVLFT